MSPETPETPGAPQVSPNESFQTPTRSAGQIAHRIGNLLAPAALYLDSVLARERQLSARSVEQLQAVQAAIEEVSHALESLRQLDHAASDAVTPATASAASGPGAGAPAGAASTGDAMSSPGLEVLLVDDDPLLLASLTHTLQFDGHAVVCAPGAAQALALAQDAVTSGRPFDVVITDLSMQDMDGRALAQRLKEAGLTRHVILLTGWGSDLQDSEQPPADVDRVMSKPPRLAALREALARVRRR